MTEKYTIEGDMLKVAKDVQYDYFKYPSLCEEEEAILQRLEEIRLLKAEFERLNLGEG